MTVPAGPLPDRDTILSALGDCIRKIENPDDLAYAAAELLGRHLNVSRAGYGTIDTLAETIAISRDWNAPGVSSLAGVLNFRDYGSYIENLKRGETVIWADARDDPRVGSSAHALEAISARALVNMPISEPDGVVALLYLNNAQPRQWLAEELDLIREVAERTRTAVERRRAERSVKQNEARLLFLDSLNREAAQSRDADYIMATTTMMLGQHLGVTSCAYADMDPDEDGFTIRGDWAAPGAMHILGHYSLADFGTKAVTELSAGRPLIINDNLKEIPPEEAAAFQKLGIGATMCMPFVKGGRLTAMMAVHHRNPRRWTTTELALLREVTERSWAHIERVRSEQAAREAAERLSFANKAAGIGTWDYDPINNVLQWDTRCKELFGLSPDAKVSYEESFLNGIHPHDRDRAHQAVTKAISSNDPYNIVFRTVGLEDGVERWIAASGNTLISKEGGTRFIGTVHDVTEQKTSEHQLRVLNETGASLARERDLQKIVQSVTDTGVELSGAEFGAFFYNVIDPKGERYMLYSLSGAPRSAFENFPMPRNTAVFKHTFEGTGVVRSDDILQDPRYGKNAPHKGMPGGHLPVRSYLAVPVISRAGEVLGGLLFGHAETARFKAQHETILLGIAGYAATAIDNARLLSRLETLNASLEKRVSEEIAERMKTEEQLRQSQKMEAVGQLTGGIAHDFNNMLAVILGALSLAKRRRSKGETDIDRFIEGAIDGANRAATLTQRLLAFSRQQPLAPEVTDINKMISGMSELLDRSLGELIRLETVMGAGLWRVKVDPAQLESAVLNLAVNARDALPKGGKLTVETSNAFIDEKYAREYALAPGQYVLLAVTDNGMGIPEDILGKVFDPFFTTKEVGKGTGLGLSQVYGFVRQSGGHVKVYSEVGVGTAVKIYLPRFAGDEDLAQSKQDRPSVGAGVQQETILVVEDDERVRAISCESLHDLGYNVVEAASAREAIRKVEEGLTPNLLFTDVVMPEMTGAELASELLKRYPTLKILFTTGYTRNAIVHNGMLDSGKHLLSKPFEIDELATKVRSLLDEA